MWGGNYIQKAFRNSSRMVKNTWKGRPYFKCKLVITSQHKTAFRCDVWVASGSLTALAADGFTLPSWPFCYWYEDSCFYFQSSDHREAYRLNMFACHLRLSYSKNICWKTPNPCVIQCWIGSVLLCVRRFKFMRPVRIVSSEVYANWQVVNAPCRLQTDLRIVGLSAAWG